MPASRPLGTSCSIKQDNGITNNGINNNRNSNNKNQLPPNPGAQGQQRGQANLVVVFLQRRLRPLGARPCKTEGALLSGPRASKGGGGKGGRGKKESTDATNGLGVVAHVSARGVGMVQHGPLGCAHGIDAGKEQRYAKGPALFPPPPPRWVRGESSAARGDSKPIYLPTMVSVSASSPSPNCMARLQTACVTLSTDMGSL